MFRVELDMETQARLVQVELVNFRTLFYAPLLSNVIKINEGSDVCRTNCWQDLEDRIFESASSKVAAQVVDRS